MATQQIVSSVVQQQKSAVAQFSSPQIISQLELTALLSLRGRLEVVCSVVRSAARGSRHSEAILTALREETE
jgi:hypothetical protein